MAAQMARTFLDDPVTSYIFRNEARREAGLRAYFRTQMKADYLPFGGCYTAEGYAGSAIWAPAGKPLQTVLAGHAHHAARHSLRAANMRTTFRMLTLVESKHPREPHWYLASLGTAVEQQGKGVGGALMRPVLAHCDAEGIPCYLESSKERNLALLSAPRLRGRRRGAAPRRWPDAVDHVAGAATFSLRSRA